MSKIRNPRYAPEFLERKLNPSTIIPIPVAAEIQVMSSMDATPANGDSSMSSDLDEPPTFPPLTPYPTPGNGEPPLFPPTLPGGGPSGPA